MANLFSADLCTIFKGGNASQVGSSDERNEEVLREKHQLYLRLRKHWSRDVEQLKKCCLFIMSLSAVHSSNRLALLEINY